MFGARQTESGLPNLSPTVYVVYECMSAVRLLKDYSFHPTSDSVSKVWKCQTKIDLERFTARWWRRIDSRSIEVMRYTLVGRTSMYGHKHGWNVIELRKTLTNQAAYESRREKNRNIWVIITCLCFARKYVVNITAFTVCVLKFGSVPIVYAKTVLPFVVHFEKTYSRGVQEVLNTCQRLCSNFRVPGLESSACP